MAKFTVTVTREIDADTAEEAALLMYQALSEGPAPLGYAITDETNMTRNLVLDQQEADDYAKVDHTADPGNW